MRILGSFLLFISALVYIGSQMNQEVVSDSVDTKLAGRKRAVAPQTMEEPIRRHVIDDVETVAVDSESEQEQEQVGQSSSEEGEVAIFETEAAIEPDPEAEWHVELKNLLIRLEPEEGEAMFEAYLNEVNSHKIELDTIAREHPESSEELITEIGRRSEAKLEEILGPHSEEVNQLLAEYVKTIKQQTRAPAEAGPEL